MSNALLRLTDMPQSRRQDNRSGNRRVENWKSAEQAEQHPSVIPSPNIPSLVQSLGGGKPDVQIAAHFGVRICRVRALRRYYGFQR
jgi:hypothetical protein